MSRRYQVQVRGEFCGAGGGWRPAITGTLNQTGQPDSEASVFTSKHGAASALRLVRAEGAAPADARVVELLPKLPGRSLTTAERVANGLALVQGLWLPAALVRSLDAECERTGAPRTAVIREALETRLAR